MHAKLEDLVHLCNQAATVGGLFNAYEQHLHSHGIDSIGYAIISDHPSLQNDNKLGLVHNNWNTDWPDHYIEQNYSAIDPAARLNLANPGIYSWQGIVKQGKLSRKQRNIFNEAEQANLYNGNTISIHGPGGTKAAAIISTTHRASTFAPHSLDIVNLATYHVHLCYLSLMKVDSFTPLTSLTVKEQEVLKWASTGLTKAEIGHQLNVSTHTVDYHIRNVLIKLDAKNTASAIVTALKSGLIAL